MIDVAYGQWQMQRDCWLNCPPAIYITLHYLGQESSALLNISNEWSGAENSVLPFLRARKYSSSHAPAPGGAGAREAAACTLHVRTLRCQPPTHDRKYHMSSVSLT